MNKTHHLTCLLADILLNNININIIDKFKCIGSIILQGGSYQRDVEQRTGYCSKTIAMLNCALWSDNIVLKTKRLLYCTIPQSILLYGLRHGL